MGKSAWSKAGGGGGGGGKSVSTGGGSIDGIRGGLSPNEQTMFDHAMAQAESGQRLTAKQIEDGIKDIEFRIQSKREDIVKNEKNLYDKRYPVPEAKRRKLAEEAKNRVAALTEQLNAIKAVEKAYKVS